VQNFIHTAAGFSGIRIPNCLQKKKENSFLFLKFKKFLPGPAISSFG
jgi:hypothetical protein